MWLNEMVTIYAVVMLRTPAFLSVGGRVAEFMGMLP